jgi:phosphoribosyl 1,2-cyclic phosphodiesterase
MKKEIKFWGTRGSCSVSGPEFVHFGGNTPSIEIEYDDISFIVDAGTGIRPLGANLAKKKEIHLFLSHTHWDHVIGFPFFEPLHQSGVKIIIWAPKGVGRSAETLFADLLSSEFFPVHIDEVQATLEFRVIEERKPVQFGPITLDFQRTRHPGLTLAFKITTPHQTIGYVTDNEIHLASQKPFVEFFKGCDVFIHEAQYFREEYMMKTGWGHSSLAEVISLIHEIEPKLWLVTHHDPKHTDEDLFAFEKLAQASPLPCPVEWIPDGYVLQLK